MKNVNIGSKEGIIKSAKSQNTKYQRGHFNYDFI